MKRAILTLTVATMVLLFVPAPVSADSSFSAHIGGNFFRYDTAYLTTGANYLNALRPDLELDIGVFFGIATEEDSAGDTVPLFLLPINLGLNFLFPGESATFLLGAGITPVFDFDEEESRFYIGPYLAGGVRLQVHPVMSWFVQAQQDLLIGGDDWINTATRLTTGINFTLGEY
ncbi:MAG: hypothetical protein ACOC28_03985 [Alkalispirochaetaceae bacterium]